jgi:hypothetical protein
VRIWVHARGMPLDQVNADVKAELGRRRALAASAQGTPLVSAFRGVGLRGRRKAATPSPPPQFFLTSSHNCFRWCVRFSAENFSGPTRWDHVGKAPWGTCMVCGCCRGSAEMVFGCLMDPSHGSVCTFSPPPLLRMGGTMAVKPCSRTKEHNLQPLGWLWGTVQGTRGKRHEVRLLWTTVLTRTSPRHSQDQPM